MRIVAIALVIACAGLFGCVRFEQLGETLSGGGVERVAGIYRMEVEDNPMRFG